MRPDRKVKSYARALLNVAISHDATREVGASLHDVVGLLRQVPVFKVFFHTRRVPIEDKGPVLRKVLGLYIHSIVIEFLAMLIEDRETMVLVEVAKQYSRFEGEALNQVPLTIYTADKLADDKAEAIVKRLEESFGKTLQPTRLVDPNLIGGIKLRLGNVYLDASLAKQMEHLKQFMIKN